MVEKEVALPKKTREIVSAYFDSTRWNDFKFRDGDIIIDTWAKTGTTWMQQIVAQLVLGPVDDFIGGGVSPWLDMRVQPFEPMLTQLEAQTHRRFVKSHLPLDALVFSPKAKYIYVARDVRDVVWSLYNHIVNYTDEFIAALNTPPGLPGQPITCPQGDVRAYYLQWLAGDFDFVEDTGFPSYWDHVQGWWDIRHLPNVLLVHFANLKADLLGEMRRIAAFLDADVREEDWHPIREHCGFDYMKKAASEVQELHMAFKGGGNTFINKGTNGRWKDVLSAGEIARGDKVAAKHLTPDCAHWLKTGELPNERGPTMAETQIAWPKKTQEIQNRICDSTRWNGFKFRDDDIVIATFGKTGTTWTQQIVAQLVFKGQDGIMGAAISPWLDMRPIPFQPMMAMLEAQQHRRFIKTHLPLQALVFSPKAKYIYVARDPRDIIWSGFNHISNFTQHALDEFNAPTDLGPPVGAIAATPRDFYLEFLDGNGTMAGGLWPMWEHFQGWWDARRLPNVLLIHFNNLKASLENEVRRIAGFLDIEIDEMLMPQILAHCDIDYMRDTARANPMAEGRLRQTFKNGADTFFNKGTNGRWKDVLSPAEIARCDEVMAQKLSPDCALWVKTGKLPAGEV